jgi:hypothetical protein
MSDARPTVAVDLDGVLATYEPGSYDPEAIGDPVPGAVSFMMQLSTFARVVVHTARVNEDGGQIICIRAVMVHEWLQRHGFPDEVEVWTGIGKPLAGAYIDDRAIECRPQAVEDPVEHFAFVRARCAALCGRVTDAEREEH